MTALQVGVRGGVGSAAPKPSALGHVPRARATSDTDNVTTAGDFQANVAMGSYAHKPYQKKEDVVEVLSPEEEAVIQEVLKDLIGMADVERADLIDELTRKAFVLMEAGEVQEATEHLQRITRISAAFQYLQRLQAGEEKTQTKKKMTDEEYLGIKSQDEVVTMMRAALDSDDFRHVFGGKARMAFFIGSW